VDREKVTYAPFDGVYVLFSSEGEDSSGVVAECDRLIWKSIVEIFDAEHQGRVFSEELLGKIQVKLKQKAVNWGAMTADSVEIKVFATCANAAPPVP